jgi:hypothetical protein
MAGLKDGDDFKDGEFFKSPTALKLLCVLVGGGGTALFLLLALFMPGKAGEMGYSWLFAVVFFLSLAVGGLFWTLLHNASNSGWGVVIRRLMENLACLIPFILILGLPLLLPFFGFRDALWEWFPKREAALEMAVKKAGEEKDSYIQKHDKEVKSAEKAVADAKAEFAAIDSPSPGHSAHFERKIEALNARLAEVSSEDMSEEAVVEKLKGKHFRKLEALLYSKDGFLNQGAWYVRFFFYFLVLTGIGWTLRAWSVKQDSDGSPKWFRLSRRWSCGFLPFFATAWTFLVFDWLMALDYTWFSTMWGVYLFAGCALNSMGLLVIVVTLLRRAGYLKNVVTMEHYHLMGKLMLAFVIFWAYIAFSQFFLIWYANITEETKFYLTRNTDFWNTYTITFLVLGHFFIPFVALLLQKVKKLPVVLSGIAVWNLVMHVLDIYWIIIPERGPSLTAASGDIQMTMPGAWLFDVLAFVSVAGLFGFFLLRQLGTASLFPCRDPRLDESLNVVN